MILKLIIVGCLVFSSLQAVSSPLFSYSTDIKLMSNIQRLGQIQNGFSVFSWQWNPKALNLDARYINTQDSNSFAPIGFIANDVQKVYPDAVKENEFGYLQIDGSILASKDQFIRSKLENKSRTHDGRCAKVEQTRFFLCF